MTPQTAATWAALGLAAVAAYTLLRRAPASVPTQPAEQQRARELMNFMGQQQEQYLGLGLIAPKIGTGYAYTFLSTQP